VASPFLHLRQQKPPGTEWAARLIPGAALADQSERKARNGTAAKKAFLHFPASLSIPVTKKVPRVQPFARIWSVFGKSDPLEILSDCMIVILDWILIGRVCISYGGILPPSRSAWPILTGTALLHAFLIVLFNRSEGRCSRGPNLADQVLQLGKAAFWGTALLSSALRLQGFSDSFAIAVCSAGTLHLMFLSGSRWAQHQCGLTQSLKAGEVRNVLIVGSSAGGRQIAKYLAEHPEQNRSFAGFLDDAKAPGSDVVGRVSDLLEMARTKFVDEVIIASPKDEELTRRVLRLGRQLRLDVKLMPQLFGCEPQGEMENLGKFPLISLHQEKLPAAALILKRALDLSIAAVALVVFTPVLLLISLLIKIESSGPILYKADRAGRKGKPFQCYKFRTMVWNADDLKAGLRERNQRSGPFFKITGDPRITRIGHLLRRYSLDELPQLWNVLKGDMSVVGPRPHPLDDFLAYSIEHLPRLDVVPGITGLWQITARRDPSFRTAMELDIAYIRNWSLSLDLSILLRTAGAVLRGSGD
jgi:exopolysaccharide biosynthesis polyprenyl glycosylphosphotransferase